MTRKEHNEDACKAEKLFSIADLGCHADGAYGHRHLRFVLFDLARFAGTEIESLALGNPDHWPDDLGDENEALQVLMQNTALGLTWILDAGNLILTTEREAQDWEE